MDNNNAEFELQVFVNGTLLRKNEMTDITIYLDKELYEYRNQTKYTGKISVVLKNPMSKIFSAKNNEVSVILSNNVPIDTKYNVKILPDNKILVVTNFSGEVLFPQSYWGKNIGLECWSHKKLNDDYSGEIVISTPCSQESYPFVFVFDVTS